MIYMLIPVNNIQNIRLEAVPAAVTPVEITAWPQGIVTMDIVDVQNATPFEAPQLPEGRKEGFKRWTIHRY